MERQPAEHAENCRNASDEQGIPWFDRLRQSGKRLICIDPMRSETVDFFGDSMEWIAPHMGTDVALMLGIAHTLVENDWQDDAFLPAAPAATIFCPLSDRRKRRRSETADWAAAICGVKADKIRELAQLFHENTTMLMAGWGMQRQQYGEQKHWMLVTLAAMLGQIGTPVADLVFPTILPTAATRPRGGAGLDAGERGRRRGRGGEDPGRTNCRGAGESGAEYQHNGMARRFPDIRFIWWPAAPTLLIIRTPTD